MDRALSVAAKRLCSSKGGDSDRRTRTRILGIFQENAPMRKMLLSLAVLALVASPAFAGKYNKVVSVGDKAPDFAGIPATENSHDTSLTLSDLKEDVVVLVFLGNHCPVVGMYDDRIIDFVNDYKNKNVRLVAVAVADMDSDRLPAIREYAKKAGINYTYGYDESQAIGRAYGATNTPHFFVLDKARKIRYIGAMDDNRKEAQVKKTYVRDAVDALLAGKDVEVEETRADGCGISYNKK
jgi:peroxiredoxin